MTLWSRWLKYIGIIFDNSASVEQGVVEVISIRSAESRKSNWYGETTVVARENPYNLY